MRFTAAQNSAPGAYGADLRVARLVLYSQACIAQARADVRRKSGWICGKVGTGYRQLAGRQATARLQHPA